MTEMTAFWLIGIFLLSSIVVLYILKMHFVCTFFSLFLLILFLHSGVFIVTEGSQVVITQFGRIVGHPYTKAGLYFKVPFIWKANYLDSRIFSESEDQPAIVTKDHYKLQLKIIFLWKIINADTYINNVDNLEEAKILLKNIVSGAVRQVISNHDLLQTIQKPVLISNSNNMTPYFEGMTAPQPKYSQSLGLYKKIESGRNELVKIAIMDAHKEANDIGVKIESILITQVGFGTAVNQKISERMVLERLRQAAFLRSLGRAEAREIEGLLAEKYQSILAPARKNALIIKGKAQAHMTKVTANAFGKNRTFYNYWRTLQAYKNNITKRDNNLIMSTDLPFLNLMTSSTREIVRPNSKKTSDKNGGN